MKASHGNHESSQASCTSPCSTSELPGIWTYNKGQNHREPLQLWTACLTAPPFPNPPPYTSPRVKTGSVMDQCRKLQRCFSQLHGRGTHAEELQTQRRTRAIQQPLPLERGQWQQWCIKLHIWAYSIHDNRGKPFSKKTKNSFSGSICNRSHP